MCVCVKRITVYFVNLMYYFGILCKNIMPNFKPLCAPDFRENVPKNFVSRINIYNYFKTVNSIEILYQ